ncbi:unnamed protein product, partial [Schistocephalus solidus]|uniref:C2H2-type domain-containing protein n=1 Tax=Schistocephalus solidus TaxID=70667 RepID=A0A183TH61_SCHSO
MLLWPPLTGTQLSPLAPRSWVLPSGHNPGNRHDRRAKPADRGSQIAKYTVVKLQRTTIPPAPYSSPYPPGCSDNPRSNRPERRTALVARELVRYKVDIGALSETRFSEQGQLEEVVAGYIFFWSGRPKAERSDADVSGMKVTSAPYQHCRCPGPSNVPVLSTHLPRANRPGWTSSDAMRHQSTIPTSTSNTANPPSDFPTHTSGINSITPTIIETTYQYSSPMTSTTATTTTFAFTTTTTTIPTTISDGDSLLNCTQCDHKFTSRIGLVGHLRIHRSQTGEPVPGAPTHSRDRHPHCHHAFTHRMGLFSHMRINHSIILRNANNTDTSRTPSAPAILTATVTATVTSTTINNICPASTDFSCPHCARNFNSRIGLVSHLRIHRTEAGEP